MTEDEAKTKACFRAATFGASQQLADGPGPHCVAAYCMAWRWSGAAPGPKIGSAEFAVLVSGTAARRDEVRAQMDAKREGFCGLVGAPV